MKDMKKKIGLEDETLRLIETSANGSKKKYISKKIDKNL